nr:hypothetical protein Iba_chr03aCG2620 [Ipomoea batatas]
MPLKFDPTQIVEVFVRVTGGEVGAASSQDRSARSPPRRSVQTSPRTGRASDPIRVTVKLTVQNRKAKVSFVPSRSPSATARRVRTLSTTATYRSMTSPDTTSSRHCRQSLSPSLLSAQSSSPPPAADHHSIHRARGPGPDHRPPTSAEQPSAPISPNFSLRQKTTGSRIPRHVRTVRIRRAPVHSAQVRSRLLRPPIRPPPPAHRPRPQNSPTANQASASPPTATAHPPALSSAAALPDSARIRRTAVRTPQPLPPIAIRHPPPPPAHRPRPRNPPPPPRQSAWSATAPPPTARQLSSAAAVFRRPLVRRDASSGLRPPGHRRRSRSKRGSKDRSAAVFPQERSVQTSARDWKGPDPSSGVTVQTLRFRIVKAKVVVSSAQASPSGDRKEAAETTAVPITSDKESMALNWSHSFTATTTSQSGPLPTVVCSPSLCSAQSSSPPPAGRPSHSNPNVHRGPGPDHRPAVLNLSSV